VVISDVQFVTVATRDGGGSGAFAAAGVRAHPRDDQSEW